MPPRKREPDKHRTSPQIPESVRHNQERLRAQLQAHFEVAWVQWSEAMKDVDPRTMLLLRAAFQAGYEARQ